MPAPLTAAERRTFDWIRSYIETNGAGPTFREIAEGVGRTKVTVYDQVNGLIKKGAIIRGARNKSRSLSLGAAVPASALLSAAEAVTGAARACSESLGDPPVAQMVVPASLLTDLARAVEASKPSAAPPIAQGAGS